MGPVARPRSCLPGAPRSRALHLCERLVRVADGTVKTFAGSVTFEQTSRSGVIGPRGKRRGSRLWTPPGIPFLLPLLNGRRPFFLLSRGWGDGGGRTVLARERPFYKHRGSRKFLFFFFLSPHWDGTSTDPAVPHLGPITFFPLVHRCVKRRKRRITDGVTCHFDSNPSFPPHRGPPRRG